MQLIKNYEKAVKSIAKEFIGQYFNDCNVNVHWIGGIRRVIQINDYFFDVEFMIDALRLNATEREVFDYYDEALKCMNKGKFFPSFEDQIRYFRGLGVVNVKSIGVKK